MINEKFRKHLRYVSLVVLTLQSVVLGLSMRYARVKPGDMFISSTAVIMSEAVKLVFCLGLVYFEKGCHGRKFGRTLNREIARNPLDTLKVNVWTLAEYFEMPPSHSSYRER